MAAVSKAHATWEGDLIKGKGSVWTESKVLPASPVSWRTRAEDRGSGTSPEELLAASHAACFSMALSNGLAKAGTPPQSVRTTATATFEKVGDGFKVSKMELHVTAKVPGVDANKFQELAKTTGETGCPISKALAGNVAISVVAKLE